MPAIPAVLAWVLAACLGGGGGGQQDVTAPVDVPGCRGAEGCACYPNATCDGALRCASGLCVDLGAAGGTGGGTAPAGGSSGTASAGSGGIGEGGGGAGASAPPAPSGGCADGGRASVTGSLRTAVAEIVFDRVTVEVHHKRDVDMAEDGCLRQLGFELQAGEGCRFDVVAGEEIDLEGRMKILSAQLSADSQCPMFPDDAEGDYTLVTPLRFGGVRMQYASVGQYNVAEACISNTFYIEPSGSMAEVASGRSLEIAAGSQLAITGAFRSSALDGRCPIHDVPPTPPPTAGTGSAGTGSAGTGSAGTGSAGTQGTPVQEENCVNSTSLGYPACVCNPCTTVGCGQGTCAGFSDCCGRSAQGTCLCADPSALGVTCQQLADLVAPVYGELTPVASCP